MLHTVLMKLDMTADQAARLSKTIQASRRSNTITIYIQGVREWTKWAAENAIMAFPLRTKDVLLFLMALYEKSVSLAKCQSCYFGLAWLCKICGDISDPFDNFTVQSMLESARRNLDTGVGRKEIIDHTMVRTLWKLLLKYPSFVNLRLSAMIALGFYGFMRISEILNLKWSDLSFEQDHVCVYIRNAKTDVYRDGQFVYIARAREEHCPVNILHNYMSESIVCKDNYVFCNFPANGAVRRLSYGRAREVLLNVLDAAGKNSLNYGWHSLRAGGCTAALEKGASVGSVMRHGRWRTSQAMSRYVAPSLKSKLYVTRHLYN